MSRNVLHIDANCFYAAVEMQRNPELRNKPVAVGGREDMRHGIILTANYIAKPYGVKTGMAIWQAKQLCPELIVLPPDMNEYIRFSKMAREVYETYTDQVEMYGLDEGWLDVTGSVGIYGSPMTIAETISQRIQFELGITVSIGVSFNKVFAKLGSDYRKPNAITRIDMENYKEIVFPLPVKDLFYVGPRTAEKLRTVGIHTIGQLAEAPVDFLVRRLGKMGGILHAFANGVDISPVLRTDHVSDVKSVGNSATTPRDIVCDEDVYLMLLLLAESVACRMRELLSRCTVVEIYVRDSDLQSFCRQKKLKTPICSSTEIAKVAFSLFQANYPWDKPIRSVGVRGAGLVMADSCLQLSLLEEDLRRDRGEQLDAIVDQVRRRYGYMSIRRARTMADPLLGSINPKDDHTVHPMGYFGR